MTKFEHRGCQYSLDEVMTQICNLLDECEMADSNDLMFYKVAIQHALEQNEKLNRQIDQMRDCRNCKNLNERNYSIKTERCYNCKPSTLSEWVWESEKCQTSSNI